MKFETVFERVGWSAIVVVCLFVGARAETLFDRLIGIDKNLAVVAEGYKDLRERVIYLERSNGRKEKGR